MNVHTLFTGVANTHLIESERGVIVIDAGMPRQAQRVINAIRALGHSPQDVRLILLTHGHIDHAGSAVALKRLTGAPIALHRADARLTATRDLKIPPGRNATTDVIGQAIAKFGWVVPLETFMPDIWLDDGMMLRDFGIDARVVHTPGHTAGSISIACEDGTLFVGDALLNVLHISFPLWWEDSAAAHESACKIRALQPRVCYSGHGRAFGLNALDMFVEDHCG
ncbi:MAG: MBL fold metallo-hydrolase [Gemmatimonadota bacterium]|nr:MBL fold metallo-hydrolase [Gemmatimonadota bacterium]